MDQLAIATMGVEVLDGFAVLHELTIVEQKAQHLHALGPDVDPGPGIPWPVAAFVDRAVQAEALEHEGTGQAIEARANDRDFHAATPASRGFHCWLVMR
ncbi:hypothetical protein D3C81_674890 [compost metagenome]